MLLRLISLLTVVYGIPLEQHIASGSDQQCLDLLRTSGMSRKFPVTMDHLHDATVETLQYFIDPLFGVPNFVPVVNADLGSPELLLEHAPHEAASPFASRAFKRVDQVLRHMGDAEWGMGKGFGTVERILHTLHMQESWTLIQQKYREIKGKKLPPNFCECAMNVERNGILEVLRLTALQLREPEKIFGGAYLAPDFRNSSASYSDNVTIFRSMPVTIWTWYCEYVNGSLDCDNPKFHARMSPAVESAEAWAKARNYWSQPLVDESVNDIAHFLRCALKKAKKSFNQ